MNGVFGAFKLFRKNCCGLDVHKTWIYACIGITNINGRTEYKQARFSSFSKGLRELADWLAKYHCFEICMESSGKYWIPVFNVLEKADLFVTLAHPKYTKPQKGNKTDRKDVKWICDLFMCHMTKPSFIPPADIRHLRDLVRYRFKLTCIITGVKTVRKTALPYPTASWMAYSATFWGNPRVPSRNRFLPTLGKFLTWHLLLIDDARRRLKKSKSFLKSVVICLSSPQQNTSFHGQDAVPVTTKALAKSNPPGFPMLVPILNQFC